MSRDSGDSIGSFLLGFMAGAAGGALMGVLFAPKSGDEFREDLQDRLTDFPDKITKDISDPKARQFIDRTRHNIESRVEQVRANRRAERLARAKEAEQAASGYDY